MTVTIWRAMILLLKMLKLLVYPLEWVYSCINCKKGSIEVGEDEQLGTYKLCKMTQVPYLGKLTAKLFLETFNCELHVTVRAYEPQEIISANLIQSPRFDTKCNEFHVLTSVSKKVILASSLPITFTNHLQCKHNISSNPFFLCIYVIQVGSYLQMSINTSPLSIHVHIFFPIFATRSSPLFTSSHFFKLLQHLKL